MQWWRKLTEPIEPAPPAPTPQLPYYKCEPEKDMTAFELWQVLQVIFTDSWQEGRASHALLVQRLDPSVRRHFKEAAKCPSK
jgi:hypothetical protein